MTITFKQISELVEMKKEGCILIGANKQFISFQTLQDLSDNNGEGCLLLVSISQHNVVTIKNDQILA